MNTIKLIAAKAKKIREKSPSKKWIDCIREASKSINGVKKAAPKKKAPKKAAKKKADNTRQTGNSNKFYDKMVKAKEPGRRVVKHADGSKHVYYERRKNRSDKPGQMTGFYYESAQNKIPARLGNEMHERDKAVRMIKEIGAKLRTAAPGEKRDLKKSLVYYRKLVATAKANINNLKKLI